MLRLAAGSGVSRGWQLGPYAWLEQPVGNLWSLTWELSGGRFAGRDATRLGC